MQTCRHWIFAALALGAIACATKSLRGAVAVCPPATAEPEAPPDASPADPLPAETPVASETVLPRPTVQGAPELTTTTRKARRIRCSPLGSQASWRTMNSPSACSWPGRWSANSAKSSTRWLLKAPRTQTSRAACSSTTAATMWAASPISHGNRLEDIAQGWAERDTTSTAHAGINLAPIEAWGPIAYSFTS